jgi:predicted transcriptional regulator
MDLTQVQMARKLGVSQATVCKVEKGLEPTLGSFIRALRMLRRNHGQVSARLYGSFCRYLRADRAE